LDADCADAMAAKAQRRAATASARAPPAVTMPAAMANDVNLRGNKMCIASDGLGRVHGDRGRKKKKKKKEDWIFTDELELDLVIYLPCEDVECGDRCISRSIVRRRMRCCSPSRHLI
jgi:hypothetical protein